MPLRIESKTPCEFMNPTIIIGLLLASLTVGAIGCSKHKPRVYEDPLSARLIDGLSNEFSEAHPLLKAPRPKAVAAFVDYYQGMLEGNDERLKKYLHPETSMTAPLDFQFWTYNLRLYGRGKELVTDAYCPRWSWQQVGEEKGYLLTLYVRFAALTNGVSVESDLWLDTTNGWKVVPDGKWSPIIKEGAQPPQ